MIVSPTFVKFSRIFLLSAGCHPLDGVTRGGPPTGLPSDATVAISFIYYWPPCFSLWCRHRFLLLINEVTQIWIWSFWALDRLAHGPLLFQYYYDNQNIHWASKLNLLGPLITCEIAYLNASYISAIRRCIFTALHAMQTRSSNENYVCLSVRLSVRLSYA